MLASFSIAAGRSAPSRRPRPSAACLHLVGLCSKGHPLSLRRYDIFLHKAPKHDGPSVRPRRLRTALFRPPREASRLQHLRRLRRFRKLQFHHAPEGHPARISLRGSRAGSRRLPEEPCEQDHGGNAEHEERYPEGPEGPQAR
jgi:hypothetical protein